LKDLKVMYADDNDTDPTGTPQDVPVGMYIIGMTVNTDDPSSQITRLDFLLSEGVPSMVDELWYNDETEEATPVESETNEDSTAPTTADSAEEDGTQTTPTEETAPTGETTTEEEAP